MRPSIFLYLRIVFAYCFGDGKIKTIGMSVEERDEYLDWFKPIFIFFLNRRLCKEVSNTHC